MDLLGYFVLRRLAAEFKISYPIPWKRISENDDALLVLRK